ncbi:hypothetical protein TSUD_398110 [Trifolium subterraneum]|uniref:Uncharacterized protein n=1 Tax=Trifolium subterraneum TaxID=3900 RepID=A0A2Z6NYP6_TRISU|nr:hypothetical protein TSUD_398110 [Trifolium subterraneum]
MANSPAYRFFPPNMMTEARPMTRPGQFDDLPWNKSMASFSCKCLTYLEHKLEVDTLITDDLKKRLKQMQESDADPELIDIIHCNIQYMLALLEKVTAEIALEKKRIAEAQKHTTEVPKKQVKRPRKVLPVSDQQMNIEKGKQTTEVPKQQEKKLRLITNN